MTRWVLAACAVVLLTGCAQPRQPTGGPPIDRPPQLVYLSPEPLSVVTDLGRPAVFRFEERLSERLQGVRELADAVIVSPETGEVRVRRSRREIRVSLANDWQPGLVYRVQVLPVIRDLYNNVLDAPIELVFSTGPDIPETAVAGLVEDRITGRPVPGARVEATHVGTGHAYVALTDSAGFFALRHVPTGEYGLQAWLDQNRNREMDFNEPQDGAAIALAAQDTMVLELALLPQDTTPARLLRAEMLDSSKVQVAFDDYFGPVDGPMAGTAALYRLEDSTYVTHATIFHGTQLDSLRAAEAAVAELAAAAARAATDTIPAEPDLAQAAPTRRRAPDPRRPLPTQELVLLLGAPLEPDTRHYVVMDGLTNIRGVPGGGGTAPFRSPPPRPAEPAPDDPGEPDPPDAGDLAAPDPDPGAAFGP
jgi:hypothetical protein